MKNFEKYITLNFLAVLGLIFLVVSLTVIFCLYPDITAYDHMSGEDAPYGIFGLMSFCAVYLFINTLIELAVLPCLFLEFLIYKLKKTEPKFIKITDKLKNIRKNTVLKLVKVLTMLGITKLMLSSTRL